MRIVAAGGVLAAVLAAWFAFDRVPAETLEERERATAARLMSELMSGKVPVGGPFTLADQQGQTRHLGEFQGKVVLLYFGYTFCPDVCPTDLLAIAQTLKQMGAAAEQVQPVFITLDPERDTPQALGPYVAAFDPRIVALHGTEAEVRAIATAYKVYFRKITPPGSRFHLIEHTAMTFIVDRAGKYFAFQPSGTPPERMAVMVKEALQRAP